MKVLLVSTLDTGGAGTACVRLHLGLLEQGIQSKLLVLIKNRTDIPESYAFYEKTPLEALWKKAVNRWATKYYTVKKLPQGYEGFSFPYSAYKLHQHPLYKWADVINLHWVVSFFDYPSFFNKNKKPIVWTLHDMTSFSGGYHYKIGFPMEAYQSYIQQNELLKQEVVAQQPLTIVALCNWMKELSTTSLAFQALTHHQIPNGIDTTIFKPYNKQKARAAFKLPTNKKIILFVAESVSNKRKGYTLLQDALQLLPNKEHILLGVLGSGVVSSNSIDIHSFGYIQEERLLALIYAAADLFVIPSIEDNLPNTVVESICCGTPVVGFAIGGIPDMIQSGFNGLLCEEVTPVSLGKTINQALTIAFDSKSIRKDAKNRFDKAVQAKNYIDLFQSVL